MTRAVSMSGLTTQQAVPVWTVTRTLCLIFNSRYRPSVEVHTAHVVQILLGSERCNNAVPALNLADTSNVQRMLLQIARAYPEQQLHLDGSIPLH